MSALAGSELQLLATLSGLLQTVVVPPDPLLGCGIRHERGLRGICDPADGQLRETFSNATHLAWFVLVSAACHQEAVRGGLKLSVRLAEYRVNTETDFGRPPSDHAIRRAVYHPEFRQDGAAATSDLGLATRLRALKRLKPFSQLDDTFACGGAEQDCWADVGSALVCRHRRDRSRWVLAGMVPWGRLHDECNELVTYINIGLFGNWIRDCDRS
ncbi:Phenoloxidase-activating factor 2 [Amphibalanus amphitrite]|uniref:Phenoloxidase-activating factor 2 n=1 Tax=Amphibalanus amphitrite TaxID=1232801 RepID=A0A6A4WUY1_AMPAM|nr:Phenoloxidase-activating factor 2 [Amphibalanus amphitrite]